LASEATDQVVRLAAPSPKGVVRIVAIVAACAIGLYLTWRVRDVLRLTIIALFVALTLNPIVDMIDRRVRVPRAAVIVVLFVLLAGAVFVIGAKVAPSMVKQVQQISHDAPHYVGELRRNSTFRGYDNRYHVTNHLLADARALPQKLAHATGALQTVTVKVFSLAGQLATVLSLSFLLMLNGRKYVNLALALAGPREPRYRKLVGDITQAVAAYMLGNIAISALCTLATWIVLSILGVPYALALAIVVGFFDLIPLVGATLGAIIAALATATVDFPTATIVWVIFAILYQRFENYLVQPLVYGRALDVNPIVTILGVLIGAALLGILGALLAIPVAAGVQILLRDWWANRPATPGAEATG
jgi:predicted PurR-regulated permease PerM